MVGIHLFRLSALSLLLALLPLSLPAQFLEVIDWEFSHSPAENLTVGDEVILTFEGTIDPGYYTYSATPPEDMPSLGTFFDLDDESKGIEVAGSLKEEGKKKTKYEEVFETNVDYYTGTVTFRQALRITEANPKIEGYLSFQSCNDSGCVPGSFDFSLALEASVSAPKPKVKPKSPPKQEISSSSSSQAKKPTTIPVVTKEESMPPSPQPNPEIAPAEEDSTAVKAVIPESFVPEEPTLVADSQPAVQEISATQGGSLWATMLKGFLLGFLAVLTPCVFPLIPLTVSYFTKRNEQKKSTGIRDALIYGGSIILIYTGFGVALSAIFGPQVMQKISIHPIFNISLAVMLGVFALSFLGMFELTLPSSWSTALSKGSDRGGILGIFLMALTLAIVSFSCTGPLVGSALGEAFAGGGYFAPAMIMLAFSTALALPFMLFAIFPHWLNKMPQSGGWLNAVKVTLGLLELAFAFIYLSRADLTMHWGLLSRTAFIGAWIVIFTMLGTYLLGKIQLPHDSPVERISVPRFLLAMSSFWFVFYLIPGLWGAPLKMLGGYIPPSTQNVGVLLLEGQTAGGGNLQPVNDICTYPNKISEHLSEGTPRGFCAFYDLDQGLEYARANNKPVFLDFTGHTCANCRYLEKNVWVDPEIQRMINEEFVLVSLYTDDRIKLPEIEKTASGKKIRTVGDKWLQYEVDTYQSNAQPLYVLLDHDNTPLIPAVGYDGSAGVKEYRDFFQRGIEAWKAK